MTKTTKICELCGREYLARVREDRPESKFCSRACSNKAKEKQTIVNCVVCGKEFEVKQCRADTAKYCSFDCKYSNLSKQLNKRVERYCVVCGKKFVIKRHRANEAKYCSQECMGVAYSQESSHLWKRDEAGYKAIHDWVRKNKPKPEVCERCGKVEPYDLANISGEYKREINDFEWLCRKCHMIDDGRLEKVTKLVIKFGEPTRFKKRPEDY